MKKMPDFAVKWIAALASGKYRRTIGRLRSPDGKSFCCLGVAQDLYPDTVWSVPSSSISNAGMSYATLESDPFKVAQLPHLQVSDALGLTNDAISDIANNNDRISSCADSTFTQMLPVIIGIYERKGYDVSVLKKPG